MITHENNEAEYYRLIVNFISEHTEEEKQFLLFVLTHLAIQNEGKGDAEAGIEALRVAFRQWYGGSEFTVGKVKL